MLPRAPHITSPFYVFVRLVCFDLLYLFEMTRPKKSTTTKANMLRTKLPNLTRVPSLKEPNVKIM